MANSDQEKPQRSNVNAINSATSRFYNPDAERKDNVIGAIAKWERGETMMNPYQLFAVCRVLDIENCLSLCADFRPELNDTGLKKLDAYKADLLATGRYMPLSSVEENTVEYIDMPFSYLSVSAGLGEYLGEEQFEIESFPASSVPAGADFALRINGDSMEPIYSDNQIVWVEKTADLQVGEVGIFIVDGEGLLKVLGEQDADEDETDDFTDSYGEVRRQPVLISYNKKYNPRVISASSEFIIVGRVLH
jgi:SOS-response transcriptional repressor LexA